MRSVIRYVDPSYRMLDEKGIPFDHFRTFMQDVYRFSLIIGDGSPEGVVEAVQGREYLNENGSAGSIKYIKQFSDIGGDRSKGWIAIG